MNDEYAILLDLYRTWINPCVRAINVNECDDTCNEHFLYVEQCLIEGKHLANLYPNLYGCATHGTFRVISLNHPKTKFYIQRWHALLDARRVVRTQCNPACSLINIPKYFYMLNEIQLYYKPAFFCPTHGSVHFCRASESCCRVCECCLRKEKCPFQCCDDRHHGNCSITGQVIDVNIADGGHTSEDIERAYKSANQHTYFRPIGNHLIEHTKERIKENIVEWIAMARDNTKPLTQSPETLFNKMMRRYCYICTDEDGREHFFRPGIEIVRYINYVCTLNTVPFTNYENLHRLLYELWHLLFYHATQILGWEYIITLAAHLSAEFGLQLRDMRLELREEYIYVLHRLRHTPPPHKSKKTNVLMKSQMFNNVLHDLPYDTQLEICTELRKRKFELFHA